MEQQDIIDNLETLANGCDPVTGEIFPENSPYNHPRIIRTLFGAVSALKSGRINRATQTPLTQSEKQQVNRDKGLPFNHGLLGQITIDNRWQPCLNKI